MKPQTFSALICGYGVPKNILKDQNYNSYLTQVFNFLFDRFANQPGTVVLSGGPTDCFAPYRRTEAKEMLCWFQDKTRHLKKQNKISLKWKFRLESKSLSTVENLLYSKSLLNGKIFIFAEKTRTARVKKLTKQIFDTEAKNIFFDFDGSETRYKTLAIKKREQKAMRLELSCINNPKQLKKRRGLVKEKLSLMRKYGPEEGLRKWLGQKGI
jgi:hypothetical protein